MADTKETIADIVAEIRQGMNPNGTAECQYLESDICMLADRLEAAHKRERGDAAKLREALCEILSYIETFHKYITPDKGKRLTALFAVADTIRGKTKAALAAPPRNCDKYATADEALKAQEQMFNDSNFANGECKLGCPECDNPRVGCKIAWLLAPATEQEGNGDAD